MRKMASIQRIDKIEAIVDADLIEVVVINSWKVVVKKGEFQVGEYVVFCEVDSWIPNEIAPFLTAPGHFPKEYLGIKGEKLRTKKLRGVISQGLVLPISIIRWNNLTEEDIGFDVSERLSIVKYEQPVPAQLVGQTKGNFPSLVPKTDEERVQNLTKQWSKMQGLEFEVTEKLEGSSCSFYLDTEGNFEVCSRNLSLKEDENNVFWKAASMYKVKEKMLEQGLLGVAIQGELVGEGIQGNIYGIKGVDFYAYTVYNTCNASYLSADDRYKVVSALGLKHVPFFGNFLLGSIEDVLADAEGKSAISTNPKQEREGLVFKCISDPSIHFKAISNKYLLKAKE